MLCWVLDQLFSQKFQIFKKLSKFWLHYPKPYKKLDFLSTKIHKFIRHALITIFGLPLPCLTSFLEFILRITVP